MFFSRSLFHCLCVCFALRYHIVIRTIVALVLISSSFHSTATTIEITDKTLITTFTFSNPDTSRTATDFEILYLGTTKIGSIDVKATYVWTKAVALTNDTGWVLSGGSVSPNDTQTFSLTFQPGFPAGTMFEVLFSFTAGGVTTTGPVTVTKKCTKPKPKVGSLVDETCEDALGTVFPTPEPATLALLGIGLAGLAATRYRKLT